MARENRATAEATMEKLLDAILRIKSTDEFRRVVTETLFTAFDEVSALGWRHGLETLADHLETGLRGAHEHGIPPDNCGVDVTDLIMAARALAEKPPRLATPPPAKETTP